VTLTPAAPVPVNSTLLASVTYAVGQSILQLEFCDGAIYRYFAVPAAIYTGLLAADSSDIGLPAHGGLSNPLRR
jgi:hypothetical protein